MTQKLKKSGWWSVVLGLVLATMVLPIRVAAQDQYQQQDDPPSRVARIGYMEGSVSFQPAGETEWVQAVPNRPMTTGDKIWADKDSRAELQLGSAVIRLSANTGFSFLNLDDHTAQIQLTSGTINIRVRRLDQNDIFEIDTPNLAFTVSQPGVYRLDASEDGSNTAVSDSLPGEGDATGNGQTYTIHQGQLATFNGTDSLNADVGEQIQGTDQFDTWAYERDRRYDNSRSAQYLSPDLVGYEDLDDNGDWRNEPTMVTSGFPAVWRLNGRRIRKATGIGLIPGDGPGRGRVVGLRAISLWPMGLRQWTVGLGGRTRRGGSGLRSGAGSFCWRWRGRIGLAWRQCGMVPAGAAGSLSCRRTT